LGQIANFALSIPGSGINSGKSGTYLGNVVPNRIGRNLVDNNQGVETWGKLYEENWVLKLIK